MQCKPSHICSNRYEIVVAIENIKNRSSCCKTGEEYESQDILKTECLKILLTNAKSLLSSPTTESGMYLQFT